MDHLKAEKTNSSITVTVIDEFVFSAFLKIYCDRLEDENIYEHYFVVLGHFVKKVLEKIEISCTEKKYRSWLIMLKKKKNYIVISVSLKSF